MSSMSYSLWLHLWLAWWLLLLILALAAFALVRHLAHLGHTARNASSREIECPQRISSERVNATDHHHYPGLEHSHRLVHYFGEDFEEVLVVSAILDGNINVKIATAARSHALLLASAREEANGFFVE
jgi:hypothetical protein